MNPPRVLIRFYVSTYMLEGLLNSEGQVVDQLAIKT